MSRQDRPPGDHLSKMTPGWLFPYLVAGDDQFGTQRWAYWQDTLLDLKLLDAPIPRVDFGEPDRETVRHVNRMLTVAEWQGIRHSDAFEAFVCWLLHGFGDTEFRQYATADAMPDLRLPPVVLNTWYEQFELGRLQLHPADYCAHFAQGGENKGYNAYRGAGFFATPMHVCTMMADVKFAGEHRDTRILSVLDPCCGTGSLLLAASNYSLNLFGNDVMPAMVRMARLNGWLYAPWMVWIPDFSQFGGPTPEQCRAALFGACESAITFVDTAAPEPATPGQPVQLTLPLFESVLEVK